MAEVLHWGTESIALADTVNVDGLKAEIERAARIGGGWVTVNGKQRSVDLFVTPGQYIHISTPAPGAGRMMAL